MIISGLAAESLSGRFCSGPSKTPLLPPAMENGR
jgi:hypothetical protein